MKNRFYAWLECISPRRIVCVGLIALMLMMCLEYIAVQNGARQAIHALHAKAVAGESISCTQTWSVRKYYNFAVAGLSDAERAAIDDELHEIASIYMAQQEALTEENSAYGRNDDPDPGPHVDDNGYKADIPSAWIPPIN